MMVCVCVLRDAGRIYAATFVNNTLNVWGEEASGTDEWRPNRTRFAVRQGFHQLHSNAVHFCMMLRFARAVCV